MNIIRRVEAGEQNAVRFEAAFEFRGDLHRDGPCEVMQAQAGDDDVNAMINKGKRLAVVELNDVSVSSGLFGGKQVFGRKIGGDDSASRVQQLNGIPAASASKFENESIHGFLVKQWNPFT